MNKIITWILITTILITWVIAYPAFAEEFSKASIKWKSENTATVSFSERPTTGPSAPPLLDVTNWDPKSGTFNYSVESPAYGGIALIHFLNYYQDVEVYAIKGYSFSDTQQDGFHRVNDTDLYYSEKTLATYTFSNKTGKLINPLVSATGFTFYYDRGVIYGSGDFTNIVANIGYTLLGKGDYGIQITQNKDYDPINKEWTSGTKYDLPVPEELRVSFPHDTNYLPANFELVNYTYGWINPDSIEEMIASGKDVELQVYAKFFIRHRQFAPLSWKYSESSRYFYVDVVPAKDKKETWHFPVGAFSNDYPESNLLEKVLTDMNLYPTSQTIQFQNPDFMFRYRYQDDNGKVHYSNYVLCETSSDGSVKYKELKGEDIDNKQDNDGNIIDDSDEDNWNDYKEEDSDYKEDQPIIHEDDELTFLGILNYIYEMVAEFPSFIRKMFGFLPNWVFVMIGMGFTSTVILRIIGR